MTDWKKYERQVIDYHKEQISDTTWLWYEIPHEELWKCAYFTDFDEFQRRIKQLENSSFRAIQDEGWDGLSYRDGIYEGIQAKCWNHTIDKKALGSTMDLSFEMVENGYTHGTHVYYTSQLSPKINERFKERYHLWFHYYNPDMNSIQHDTTHTDETQFKLYEPQRKAIDILKQGWKGVGVLSMACGIGKTVCVGHICTNYSKILVIAHLQVQASSILNRLRLFAPNHHSLLVDAEGVRDDTVLENVLHMNNVLVSSTMYSVDIWSKYIDQFDLVIVDEAHNLPSEKQAEQCILHDNRALLVSGTPPEYENSTILYQYTLQQAIENNYIVDYQILLPLLDDGNIHVKNGDLYGKCSFLTTSALRFGLRRIIVYCQSIDECKQFIQKTNEIFSNEFYQPFKGETITKDDSKKQREEILKWFQRNEKPIKVIASVRILDEAVDVPCCDTVYFTKPPSQKTDASEKRTIQRLCRSVRLSNNKQKATALVWCNENNDMLDFMQKLKRQDYNVSHKISRAIKTYSCAGKPEYRNQEKVETENIKYYTVSVKIHGTEWDCMSFDERLHYIYEKYIQKGIPLPNQRSKDTDVKKKGKWLTQNIRMKKRFQKLSEKTQNYIRYYLNIDPTQRKQTQWDCMSFNERLKHLYEVYIQQEISLPNQRSKDIEEKKKGK